MKPPSPLRALLGCGLLCAAVALAQDEAPSTPDPTPPAQPAAPPMVAGDLPVMAQQLRDTGVDAREVRAALQAAQQAGVPAAEAALLLEDSLEPVEVNGPIDGFGAFVAAQLAAGLRGTDLAQALHAEHAKRGIGHGPTKAKGVAKPRPVRPRPPPAPRPSAAPGPAAAPRPTPVARPTPTPNPTPTKVKGKTKGKFRPGGR